MEQRNMSHFHGLNGTGAWDACVAQFQERTETNSELFKVFTTRRVTNMTVLGF
jgi:hypothetical protein